MFLLIDKPKGITSHDVVAKIRKITGESRVGHGGTLDPNATGLLIIGVGRESTKKLSFFTQGSKKTYLAEIKLGEESTTDDSEGLIVAKAGKIISPSVKEVGGVLKRFKGPQMQTPPQFSAIKIGGKKAYETARSGRVAELKPRKVTIYSIKLKRYNYPFLEIETEVSSGTYIRALARDIGQRLACGAYLENLRRVKIGDYNVQNAVLLNELTASNWKRFTKELK